MAELPIAQIERGRRLVWIVIAITFGYEVLSILFYSIATLQMFGVLILPLNFGLLVRLILEALLLYFVYRGYGWARWVTGILFALGVILGVQRALPLLTQVIQSGAVFVFPVTQQLLAVGSIILVLTMIVAYAISAFIMLASSSVRVFQKEQRNHPLAVRANLSRFWNNLHPAGKILLIMCLGIFLGFMLGGEFIAGLLAQVMILAFAIWALIRLVSGRIRAFQRARGRHPSTTLGDSVRIMSGRRLNRLLLVFALLGFGVAVIFVLIPAFSFSPPPVEDPSVRATAFAKANEAANQARSAIVEATASTMVRETGVITVAFPQPSAGPDVCSARIYFDGERLWVSEANYLAALNPETQKVTIGPLELDRAVCNMLFDGRQLWITQRSDFASNELYREQLRAIDVESGQLSPPVDVKVQPNSLVYDRQRLWFHTIVRIGEDRKIESALRSVDPVSREVSPPIETGTALWSLVADESRHALWLINSDGKIQQYDLRQNALQDTSMQFKGYDFIGPSDEIHFDGQRLWTVHANDAESLDVDTGKTTVLAFPALYIDSSILGDSQIWIAASYPMTGGNAIQSIDIDTGQLGPAIPVDSHLPGEITFDGQRLWIVLGTKSLETGSEVKIRYFIPKD